MTVGIGAICEDGSAAVVVADRMLTFGSPLNLQTEPPAFKKITPLNVETVLVFSGFGADGGEIASATLSQLGGSTERATTQIADIVKAAYIALKRKRAEEQILRPLIGGDFGQFQTMIVQSASSQLMQQLLGLPGQHNLQLEILVCGTDNTGAHLFVTSHPGQTVTLDTQGFAAIGSGALHAAVRLSLGPHSKLASLGETIYTVYEAKRAAEVAPGVGKLTDMAIITKGKVRFPKPDFFNVLEELHKERPGLSPEEGKKLTDAYGALVENA